MIGWLWKWTRNPSSVLRVSAVLTLIGLALMVWSILEPTPLPVMLAMTVGQGFGTLAFALYGIVVARDLVRGRRARLSHKLELPPREPPT